MKILTKIWYGSINSKYIQPDENIILITEDGSDICDHHILYYSS